MVDPKETTVAGTSQFTRMLLMRSAHHRLLRTRAFVEWDAVTCGC